MAGEGGVRGGDGVNFSRATVSSGEPQGDPGCDRASVIWKQ